MSAAQVITFLKFKLEQRSNSLREAFRKVDKSNTGFLSGEDFQECLRDFSIRLPARTIAAVIAKYDVNGDGYVSYPEFCVVMSGGEPSAKLKNAQKILGPGAATDVERAEANLRRLMYAAETTLTKMYLSMNRNRGGFVSPAELARIFKMHSIELSAEEQKMILKHYDTNKDGMINLAELHKALIGEVSRFEGHRARGQKRPRA